MQNARLDESQAEIKTAGRNINKLRYADDTTLMAESEEELKHLLMKAKEESEKPGLKLNIQKKLRSWHPVPSLHGKQMGKQWKQWQTLFSCTPKSLHMAIVAMQLKDTCSLRPHGLYRPWNSPGQNTGVGSHSLLQGTFLTQESTRVSCIAGGFFTSWATRGALLGRKAMTNLDTETSLCQQRSV